MPLELLKQNVEREKQIVTEIFVLNRRLSEETALQEKEKKDANASVDSLVGQLKILNSATPALLESISFYKDFQKAEEAKEEKPKAKELQKSELVKVKYMDESKKKEVSLAIKKVDEKKFSKHLGFKNPFKKIKDNLVQDGGAMSQFESYINFSNRLMRNFSDKLVDGGYFDTIKSDLRRIASPLIVNSYVAIMLFTFIISFFISIPVFIVMLILKAGIGISLAVLFLFPLTVFLIFFFYPSSRRKNLEKEINQELPFLTIFMAAIATSGIEPSKIFNILVTSKDYPSSQREIKKLTNLINFYGYDLVSALKSASKSCPSERLGLLFDGLATTITSGGELTAFLSKHSETLLFDYRLEREKYTHVAETFMNIYISIVIAAPMIMMMLFVLISLTGFGGGFINPTNIGILTILVISLLNVGFIVFLNMKQPKF